ncbi:hypothetical protein [Nocardioides jejuensis]|uniref:Uncharacterized protein n=1 Tax=Nocardioides jejuensis TaxID=2502782 RepID=A0A4R1CIB1_9ACTN|nr:hypothetical protein [Nocardioides jejuensis]TCJ31213.1 hypothetical protein EPD65_01180 [Nocardioides jejuensis]
MKRSTVRPNDEGAMLVFAMIIVTTVSLVTGVLLAKGWTNFAATSTLRDVAGQAYAGDAAGKVAVTDLVQGAKSSVPSSVATYPNGADGAGTWVYDNNTDGTGCFGKKASDGTALDTITLKYVYPKTQSGGSASKSATVVCTPVAGTGIFGSGGGTVVVVPDASDAFARALTTMGTGACTALVSGGSCNDGITLKGLGSGTEIPVRGSIQSKTFVNVTAGTLRTNGKVVANSCTGSIIPSCTGGFVTPTAPDSPLSSVPTWQNPATQGCSFQPGFYNNGVALSTAVNSCGTATFASGKYYFDFSDNQPWDIATTVIGGVSSGGSSIPGRCVSPINSPSTSGVQFVFGGSSFVQVEDTAHVELCGPSNGGKAPLTLYQQQAGSTPGTQNVAGAASANVTTVTGGKNDAFTPNPANGANATTLTAALTATGAPLKTDDWKSTKNNNTGGLDLQNFPGLAGIPVGSLITSAKLKVTYTNGLTVANPNAAFQASVQGQAGTVQVAPSGTDTDLTTLVNAQFLASASGFSATNPKIQLRISDSNKNDTLSIDAVSLTVSWVEPALRAATTSQTFITDHGGNFQGEFVVQGATYAPKGYITLTPGSSASALVAFRWGVLAWGVNFKSQPSQVWGYPLISIPDPALGLGSAVTAVDLKVYLCAGSGPCSTSGNPALSARVQLTDGVDSDGIVHPVPGQRKVEILSWAEQR